MNKKAWIAVTIVVIVIAGGWYGLSSDSKPERPQAKVSSEQKQEQRQETASVASAQATREVTMTTSYKSPAGDDKIGFTLTIDQNGIITDAKTQVMAENDIPKKLQQSFADGVPAVLKGKKLSDLDKIDKVGGASLTTAAFNQALGQLKSQI